jgi:hypothetical protein
MVTVSASFHRRWAYDEVERAENEKRDLVLVLLQGQPRPAVPPFACGLEAALLVLRLRGA